MTVALVGAGPGAADLITVRGLQRVQAAEVVIHDRLVSPELVAMAPPDAERINVGKAPNKRRFRQDDIDRLLVEAARSGRRVVRLKGGDPFVFGLASSEAMALAREAIPFEVVPGLSAATALPGVVGAALTEKGSATAFTVLSGHYPPGHPDAADFGRLPANSTAVVLMCHRHLAAIARRLVESGWDRCTPAMLIASGTTVNEQVAVGVLDGVADAAESMAPPMTLIVGNGVALRNRVQASLQRTMQDPKLPAWGLAREPT